MTTAIATIDGVNVWGAGILSRNASFPITNLRTFRPHNDVQADMPVFVGWYEDGMKAPVIINQNVTIDTTTLTDECGSATVSMAASSCDFIAPNMKYVPLKTEQLNANDLLRPIARQRRVAPEALHNLVWDSSGNFIEGTPYRQNVLRTAGKTLEQANKYLYTNNATQGDAANALECDGLYQQLDNGWTAGDEDCGDEHNIAQVINWYYLTTEGVEATATGFNSPDAVTVTGKTIDFHGREDVPVPAGINFAEFLDELWIEYLEVNHLEPYGEPTWEAHIPLGEKRSWQNMITCLQPCDRDSSNDDDVRNRWEANANRTMLELKPSGKEFTMRCNPDLDEGTVYFGPRTLGGVPTYGAFFKPLNPYWQQLGAEMQMAYGQMDGVINHDDMLLWDDQTYVEQNFETLAFKTSFRFDAGSQNCFRLYTQFQMGVLVALRHMWLKVTGMSAQRTLLTDPGSSVTVVTA